MKTKSKSVKRKLPYDSELECESSGVSKKQNLRSNDAFGHATVVNVDNHISKSPMATYCLHGEPLFVRDLVTREPAHSRINIDSKPGQDYKDPWIQSPTPGFSIGIDEKCPQRKGKSPSLWLTDIKMNLFIIAARQYPNHKVKIPVMYITDHITKPTITITRALHITKCLQIILILLQDDDNLMRWKEQLLGAVNINAAAGILILILATVALFIQLAPHAPIIQTRIIIDPRRVATIVFVLTPNIPALYEMHFAVPMAGVVLSKK
ncbi:hypothetical protein Tco_0717833 [Tanacetum coccineum]